MKEEGFETLKSIVILTLIMGSALTVAAMVPATEDEIAADEFKPLEVQKSKIQGPVIVIMESPATWHLEIVVTNNLDPEDIVPPEDGEEPIVFYSTRGEGDENREIFSVCPNTITDVVVTDTFTYEFELMEWQPSQGAVSLETDTSGDLLLTWNVGNLKPRSSASLELVVCAANGGFAKPGARMLNSGASATGVLDSTSEALSDGPSKAILINVIDGDPRFPPVAEAGITQMAFEGHPVYLDGSESYDSDGVVVRYTWFLDGEILSRSMTVLTHLPVGAYEIMLEVEDNHGLTATDTVIVTVYKQGTTKEGGVMYGIVRDATTRRGFDPYIIVSNDDYAISTWTDMGGNYRIIGLPAGHYDVFCETPGYRDFYGEVTIEENAEVEYTINMFRR